MSEEDNRQRGGHGSPLPLKQHSMIVSEFQQRKTERHETIRAEFEQLTRDGGKKMAVYELLGKKYGYTAHRIWEIVNGREK